MRKKHFFIAGIVLLSLVILGGLYGWYLFQKPHVGVGGIKAVAHVEARGLFDGFQKDETASDKEFMGQVLEVRGKVSDVARTDSTLSVELEGESGAGGINCSMAPGENGKMPVPEKGTVITIKGRCTGFLMDVNMVDCVIEQMEK
jgi:hypothetical protein